MKIILLILITFSLSLADFTSSDEMVTDSTTNLIWQDDATPAKTTWQGAINYCEALELGAHTDWRLPNINELLSILDDTKYNPPISDVFVNTNVSIYWSSTTHRINTSNTSNTSNARGIFFTGSGSMKYSFSKTYNKYVRCVRAGQEDGGLTP